MINTRQRHGYRCFILDTAFRQAMVDWKNASKGAHTEPLPPGIVARFVDFYDDFLQGFNFMTVPAPSWHTYDHYPAWVMAQELSKAVGLPLVNLFPEKSGIKSMAINFRVKKETQSINCDPGKFVLVVDDIGATFGTTRATCEAIARCHSFPCFIVIATAK